MSYMNCPRCGLSIRLRASYLIMERCPRCLARRQAVVQMYVSDRPGGPPAALAPRQADRARKRKERASLPDDADLRGRARRPPGLSRRLAP